MGKSYDTVAQKQLFTAAYDMIEGKLRSFFSEEIEEDAAPDFVRKIFKDVHRIDAELSS